ncbi:hypothetical protein MMC06_001774 [Schaereria dolodes]|nr:hypothetical protein [Schaereria dolodes]
MGKKGQPLSPAEIWDDSALIRSWDDALEEYKLYHSIHARGERVEDVVKAEVLEDSFRSGHESPSSAAIKRNIDSQGVSEDGEVEDDPGPEILEGPLSVNEAATPQPQAIQEPARTNTVVSMQGLSSTSQNVINASLQDEATKNLMMSWYWAGYYTGLYEGQQQTSQRTGQDALGNVPGN